VPDGSVDLRSDTVTLPTPAMRRAMAEAEVGDDVVGEDPSVNRLEARAAELLGKEAGLFVPSGTQSNLCGLLAHCERGDEYLVGATAHCYRWEGGGAAVLGSIQPQPIPFEPDGTLDLAAVAAAIKPDDSHFARTRLLCLENTTDGRPLPLDYQQSARVLADEHGLGMHLDGARLWNAAVAHGVAPAAVAAPFDTVSACLSKGLGAPVGSVLVGTESLIGRARRWRKVLGGGMRQAGIIAAAGLHALDHHIERLAEDHENAHRLAEGLRTVAGVDVGSGAQTNMVIVTWPDVDSATLVASLAERGVVIRPGRTCRLVVHLDVSSAQIEHTIESVAKAIAELRR
jgi:threonine aldolase